jgi:hypothetical protein
MKQKIIVLFSVFLSQIFLFAVDFPDTVDVSKTTLRKMSEAQYRVFWIFKVFDAAFYVGENYRIKDYPGDIPFRLELSYARDIKKEQLIENADKILNDLYESKDIFGYEAEITKMNDAYEDVEKGDSYAITYLPNVGMILTFNGEEKVWIEGSDFVAFYIKIWLGDHPNTKRLAQKLLRSK